MTKKIVLIDQKSRIDRNSIKKLQEFYEIIECSGIKDIRISKLLSSDLIILRINSSFEYLKDMTKYLNKFMVKNILLVIPKNWRKDVFKLSRKIEFADVLYEPMILDELLFRVKKIRLETDNLYYKILSQMDMMAMVLDEKRNFLYANATLLEETGYTNDDIIGKNIDILKSNHHSLLFYDNLRQTLDSDSHWSGTFKNKRKDGSQFWEDASVFKIKMSYREVYVKISHNVSRRERLLTQQEKEIRVASLVQKSLLPLKLETSDLIIDGFYKPLNSVSGDIYNWLELYDDVYAVYLLDVVGHGVASALITTSAISIINNQLEENLELDELLKKLNNKMIAMYNLSDLSQSNYFTMAIGIIDLKNKKIKYANCGHHAIYLMKGNDLIELKERNFPIGLLSDKDFTFNEIEYDSPIELLFFSDGLIEIDFDKKRGIEKLKTVLTQYTEIPKPKKIIDHLNTNLIDIRDRDISDDITLTTVTIRERGED